MKPMKKLQEYFIPYTNEEDFFNMIQEKIVFEVNPDDFRQNIERKIWPLLCQTSFFIVEDTYTETEWKDMIDYKSKHLRLKRRENDWNDKIKILDAFKKLFATYKHSVLVISYRSNGIPTIDELCHILQEQGRSTSVKTSNEMKYALSNSANREVLIISMPKEY